MYKSRGHCMFFNVYKLVPQFSFTLDPLRLVQKVDDDTEDTLRVQ